MTTVITYGTFDLLHVGHIRLFQRLRELGTRLVVGVSTDEFNAVKGKRTVIPFDHRIEMVRAVRYVDAAFPEDTWEQKRSDITTHGADVFAMGADWEGKFDHLNDICKVVYLPRTDGISSTQIKTALRPFSSERIGDLKSALEVIGQVVSLLELGDLKS